MLNSLSLKNFRSHAHTDIVGLRALNVIVGPNGVGKTSVLEALHLTYGWVSEYLADPSRRTWPVQAVKLDRHELDIAIVGTNVGQDWRVEVSGGSNDEETWTSVKLKPEPQPPAWFQHALGGSAYFRFESSALRRSSYPERLPPTIEVDGYGLASAVSYLMRTDPEQHRTLRDQLNSVVPSVIGLRTNPVKVPRSRRRTLRLDDKEMPFETTDEVVGDELLFDTIDGRGIRGAAQSDGTLFVLAVLTALSLTPRPKLVLLDDIEAGIHPGAQRKLVRLLRQVTEGIGDLQIIMTSHSPYVLDELTPEEVWVAGRGGDQKVRVKRLADHPKAQDATRVLTTGEFWSLDGEDWAGERAQ